MSSVGSDLIVDRIKVNDIINWTNAEFVPPIQGGGVDTLAGVLVKPTRWTHYWCRGSRVPKFKGNVFIRYISELY